MVTFENVKEKYIPHDEIDWKAVQAEVINMMALNIYDETWLDDTTFVMYLSTTDRLRELVGDLSICEDDEADSWMDNHPWADFVIEYQTDTGDIIIEFQYGDGNTYNISEEIVCDELAELILK